MEESNGIEGYPVDKGNRMPYKPKIRIIRI